MRVLFTKMLFALIYTQHPVFVPMRHPNRSAVANSTEYCVIQSVNGKYTNLTSSREQHHPPTPCLRQ